MSETIGKQLGNFINTFVEYDANNSSGLWRSYMRIKVHIDVHQPLKRWKKISRSYDESSLVHFKYERLGNFCFLYGLLGHT